MDAVNRRPDEGPPVAVALGVKWVHGAPGLLLNSAGADLHRFGAVGVFVGPLPKTGNPINVM
jgi:hypothetical protein